MASFNKSSTEVPIWIDSKTAGGAITEGAVLKYNSDLDSVVIATAITDKPMGIARNAAASGERVSVIRAGRANVLVTASATVTQGTPAVCTGADGSCTDWNGSTSGYSVGQFEEGRVVGSAAELVPLYVNFYRCKP